MATDYLQADGAAGGGGGPSQQQQQRPSRYIIQSPGIVFLMNQFENCGFTMVNQIVNDKSVGLRVILHYN